MKYLILVAVIALAGCSSVQQKQLADVAAINAQITQTNADLVKALAASGALPPDQAAAAVLATGAIAAGAKVVASDAAAAAPKP